MDDILIWAIAGGAAAVLIPLAMYFLPAQAKIVIDTPTSTARAELRLLWGMGPAIISRALPKQALGAPLAAFSDAVRVGNALMTPGIADVAYRAVKALYDLKPRTAQAALRFDLGDPTNNLVVRTAAQAALAAGPAALRERVIIDKSAGLGAELSGDFELMASPAQLNAIYSAFRNSRAAQEFRTRLKRKPKPEKKPARDVRVS